MERKNKMKEVNLYMEKNCTPKAIPVVVPLAYQAMSMLDMKIKEAKRVEITPNVKASSGEEGIPIWKRYSLSIPEAARYFGIGEKRLYQIISEHQGADFILEIGTHTKIKRELFSKFLDRASCV